MAETLIETPAGFDKLSKVEQLCYLQALSDQISSNQKRFLYLKATCN